MMYFCRILRLATEAGPHVVGSIHETVKCGKKREGVVFRFLVASMGTPGMTVAVDGVPHNFSAASKTESIFHGDNAGLLH